MNEKLIQIFLGFFIGSLFVFFYIENYISLTSLRLAIPDEIKKLKEIRENNARLKYEIDQFENPLYLMELLQKPEFSHLKFPKEEEITIIQ